MKFRIDFYRNPLIIMRAARFIYSKKPSKEGKKREEEAITMKDSEDLHERETVPKNKVH